jgi:4-hydroxy-tetrahydrodipicolinate synthase
MVTLFDADGALLAGDTADLAARLVDLGVKAILLAGATGEPWALGARDRIELCAAVRKRIPENVPVLLGTGAFSWEDTERLTRDCSDADADVFLIMPPPGQSADVEHFARLRDIAGKRAIWAYHVPEISAPGVPIAVAPKLDVDALKDSSGDADRLTMEVMASDRPVYVGSPTVMALAGALGVAGGILALAATELELSIASFAGDLKAQAELARLHVQSLPNFPTSIKQSLHDIYGTPINTRPKSGRRVAPA